MDSPFEMSKKSISSKCEDSPIFKTKEPFDGEFQPETILERDNAINSLGNRLDCILRGHRPPNILIDGVDGLGKTLVTRYVLEQLQKEVQSDVTIIHIDCRKHETIYQILLFLVNDLSRDTFKQGHPTNTLREKVYHKFNEIGGYILLVLNNIEELDADDRPIAEFQEASVDGDIEDAKIGIIGICNRANLSNHLIRSVHNQARTSRIHFEPYDAKELLNILEYYADIAFKKGVLSEDVVPKCAAITAQLTGDARTGLTLLELSGDLAEAAQAGQVTEKHVDVARSKLDQIELINRFVEDLSREEQLVGLILALLEVRNDSEIEFKHIYSYYSKFSKKVEFNQVSERRVRDFLQPLEEKSLVSVTGYNEGGRGRKDGERGGIWFTYSLEVPPSDIIEAARSAFPPFRKLITYDDERRLGLNDEENG